MENIGDTRSEALARDRKIGSTVTIGNVDEQIVTEDRIG
jgi:hypothetical protein